MTKSFAEALPFDITRPPSETVQPAAPPVEAHVAPEPTSKSSWTIAGSARMFAVGLPMALVCVPVVIGAPLLGVLAFAIVGGLFGLAGIRALVGSIKAVRTKHLGQGLGGVVLMVASFGAAYLAVSAALMPFYARGRQIRKGRRLLFAPLEGTVSKRSTLECQEIAAAWRQNGLTEHASVAAFAKLSAELMALGAPAELIEASHRDALDEIRHTRLCFDLAHDLDGATLEPGPFPTVRPHSGPRIFRLCRLASEGLIEGALNEGVSARVVAQLSKEVTRPEIQQVLIEIARDEGRHAQHGFEVARWALGEGGEPVAIAMRATLLALGPTLRRGLSEATADGKYEAFGLPGRAREEAAHAVVRARVLRRTARILESMERVPGRHWLTNSPKVDTMTLS